MLPRPALSRPRPCPVTCTGAGPQPVPVLLCPAEAQEGATVPWMPRADVPAEKQTSLFYTTLLIVPFPAFSKYNNKTSAPLPQLSPGWNQDHFSLMLADMEWHKGSTENAVTAFHICPYCLFFASTSNQSTAFAGQQKTSYSCPLRREIKLGWLFTDLISWFINPTFKTEQMAHLPVASW